MVVKEEKKIGKIRRFEWYNAKVHPKRSLYATCTSPIRHPPPPQEKKLHSHCFQFLLGTENNGSAKFFAGWGAGRVGKKIIIIFSKVANGNAFLLCNHQWNTRWAVTRTIISSTWKDHPFCCYIINCAFCNRKKFSEMVLNFIGVYMIILMFKNISFARR